MTKIAGSGAGSKSGSVSERYGSADPNPDPYQIVTDPQHCWKSSYLGSKSLETLLFLCCAYRHCLVLHGFAEDDIFDWMQLPSFQPTPNSQNRSVL